MEFQFPSFKSKRRPLFHFPLSLSTQVILDSSNNHNRLSLDLYTQSAFQSGSVDLLPQIDSHPPRALLELLRGPSASLATIHSRLAASRRPDLLVYSSSNSTPYAISASDVNTRSTSTRHLFPIFDTRYSDTQQPPKWPKQRTTRTISSTICTTTTTLLLPRSQPLHQHLPQPHLRLRLLNSLLNNNSNNNSNSKSSSNKLPPPSSRLLTTTEHPTTTANKAITMEATDNTATMRKKTKTMTISISTSETAHRPLSLATTTTTTITTAASLSRNTMPPHRPRPNTRALMLRKMGKSPPLDAIRDTRTCS
ncbi:hypothetical protein B0H65DRAFT_135920 [Neurospora tetraspora]|uniref:Uncharacterized protein n=1 Tax=Neurospora tetraspora TaxID=94610 RepID=A0AAE0MUU1_9PEZI|nr:hypothetical protein B0H65DRAFT_135920 [Neurospora tetraspora]